MISSAVFVHTNGRGFSFQSAIQERMSASSAWTDVWVPRRIIWSVRNPNQRSTWLTHDELVGVKCMWKRGVLVQPCLDGGGLVGAVVVADEMDIQLGGDRGVDTGQVLANSTARCRRCRALMTVPSTVLNAANRLVMPLRT